MSKPARFHYRLGANQPATSPTAQRLGEMAEAILENYPVEEVILEIEKFALPDAKSVSIKITRKSRGRK